MKTITISSKNQVVIPSAVRARLKLRSGDRLVVDRITDTEVVFKKEPSYYDFLGIAKPNSQDPVKRIRDMRDNWRNG
ncbi:MAG: AbrB/MazE/SpoVT family DNA-binding domain-containing protein [Candidatus Saccharimonadales bacterium]